MNRSLDPQWLRPGGAGAPRAPTPIAPARGVGASLPHESAHLHVAGAAPYVDDLPELAGTLHAALGLSPVAHGRLRRASTATRIARAARRRRRARSPPTSPAPNDCGPVVHDDPILADGIVHYVGQPVFAVIAETRDLARRAAAAAKAALTIEPLRADPDAGRGARREAATCCRRCTWRAATRAPPSPPRRIASPTRSTSAARSSSISKARSRTPCRARTAACSSTARRSTRARCSTWSRTALGLQSHHVQVECRRMGGGFGGKESQSALFACVAALAAQQARPPGQAAPRPRRRLPGHRPAPLLPLRLRGRLRRRRPHPRRRADDGLARRLLGRSLRAR